MKTFAIYSGKQIRMFIKTLDEAIVKSNLNLNEQYIESQFIGDPSLYMVKDLQVVALSPRPEIGYDFNYDTFFWFNARTIEQQTAYVKDQRDDLLNLSDWIVTKAMDVGTPVPEDWKVYRQALREITLQPDVFNIIWPTAPQG